MKLLMTIFLLLTISCGYMSCSPKSVPAEGAEKRFDDGMRKDKHTLHIFPKKMNGYQG